MIGSGPGGYTAAFRAADLGLKTVLIERYDTLGGVCLNVGCIPSKALLHAARVVAEAEEMAEHGIKFGKPKVDLDALRAWKASVVDKLTGGLTGLAKQRKVEVITGVASLTGPNTRHGRRPDGHVRQLHHRRRLGGGVDPRAPRRRRGSSPRPARWSCRLIPKRLLVIGCGIIGLEMATVYDALGSKVTMVELLDQLIPGCDPDLVKPLHKRISERYEAIHLGTKVESVEASDKRPRGEAVVRRLEDVRRDPGRDRPPAERPRGRRRRGRRERRRRGLHPGRPAAAHERARGSTRSATSSAARCSPTRPRTRARSRPR